jgi:hypothetical protein
VLPLVRMRYGLLVIGFCVVCTASVLGAGTAWALDDPAGIMRLLVDLPDWMLDPTQTDNGPASRFFLSTITGDPTTSADDGLPIATTFDPNDATRPTSVTTISVDNTNAQATNTLLADLDTLQQSGGREFWPLPPTERTRDIVYRLLVPIDDTDPTQATEIIEVYAQLVLLRDTLKLDFTLINRGTQAHSVGLRHFIDCQFGGGQQQDDGTSIILSDGTIIDTETVLQAGVGNGIPDAWVSFDNISNPGVILRGMMTGAEVSDPGTATYSAGPPDRVEFGQRINMGNDDQFNFTPLSTFVITGSVAAPPTSPPRACSPPTLLSPSRWSRGTTPPPRRSRKPPIWPTAPGARSGTSWPTATTSAPARSSPHRPPSASPTASRWTTPKARSPAPSCSAPLPATARSRPGGVSAL